MANRSSARTVHTSGRLSRRLEDVSEIARSITGKRTLEHILAALMEVVTRTVSAEVGGIFARREEGLWSHVAWGLDTDLAAQLKSGDESLIHHVYASHEVLRVEHPQELRRDDRRGELLGEAPL